MENDPYKELHHPEDDAALLEIEKNHGEDENDILRCGDCGAWQADPINYTEVQLENAILIHCGCINPYDFL